MCVFYFPLARGDHGPHNDSAGHRCQGVSALFSLLRDLHALGVCSGHPFHKGIDYLLLGRFFYGEDYPFRRVLFHTLFLHEEGAGWGFIEIKAK